MKSVQTFRTVDVFISRLHPETTAAEIIDCVNEVKVTQLLVILNAPVLKSCYEHLYCSFHIAIKVDTAKFYEASDLFMSPDSWPSGTLVKKYFKPKMDKCGLNLSSFNCRSIKNFVNEVQSLCDCSDFVFLQKHWLLPMTWTP